MLIGNLGADPEVRSTSGGGRVATLSLATTRTWVDRKNEKQEKTQWHRLILWDNAKGAKLADLAEKYMHKGDRLYAEGEIEYRSWEDKEGVTHYSTEIIVRDVTLLTPPREAKETKGSSKSAGKAADPQAPLDGDDLPF